jgi:hypothetical protein
MKKAIQYCPVIAMSIALFFSLGGGLALLIFAFFLGLIIYNNKVNFNSEDVLISFYFLLASLLYLYLDINIKDYLSIIFFPVAIYFTVKSIKAESTNVVILLLISVFIYSILMFFRDADGNLNFSLSQNVYMSEREIDETADTAGRFFKNATLVSIWLVTAFVISLSLYNYTKKRIFLPCMLAAFILVFLSNTRTALGCVIVIIFLNSIIYKQRKILRFMIIAVPIAYILTLYVGNLYQFQIDRFKQLFDKTSSYGLGGREQFWKYSLNLIDQNIWGYGHSYVEDHLGVSTHNEYLGQFVSLGVIVAMIYYIFIFSRIYTIYGKIKRFNQSNIWNELSFYLMVVYLINGFTEQISLGNRFWIALMLMAIGWSKNSINKTTFVVNYTTLPQVPA